jgi:hypothetical protein
MRRARCFVALKLNKLLADWNRILVCKLGYLGELRRCRGPFKRGPAIHELSNRLLLPLNNVTSLMKPKSAQARTLDKCNRGARTATVTMY